MGDTRALGTVAEVAEHLGVPPKTLYQWKYKKTGPRAIRVGKHLRYRWSDIERWLDTQATADPAEVRA
jgi:excisionase family DNA binding protein